MQAFSLPPIASCLPSYSRLLDFFPFSQVLPRIHSEWGVIISSLPLLRLCSLLPSPSPRLVFFSLTVVDLAFPFCRKSIFSCPLVCWTASGCFLRASPFIWDIVSLLFFCLTCGPPFGRRTISQLISFVPSLCLGGVHNDSVPCGPSQAIRPKPSSPPPLFFFAT